MQAERFVGGTPAQIVAPVIGLRPTPDIIAGIDTELLFGETVRVFDRANGWAWVQADADGYAGYVPETAIGDVVAATHRVIAPRTFLYPSAELRNRRWRRCRWAALSVSSVRRKLAAPVT